MPMRKSAGRNWFSRRNVHACTTSRRRARPGPPSGRAGPPAASRGIIRFLFGPSPSAYVGDHVRPPASPGRRTCAGHRPREVVGRPGASMSWASGTVVIWSSLRRLPVSKDWMKTGSSGGPGRCGAAPRPAAPPARGRSSRSRSGAWSRGRCRSRRPLAPRLLYQVDDLLEGRHLNWPSKARVVGAHLREPLLGAQRLELGEVKSSVNQPVTARPSMVLVVLRSANSGWAATSVVPPISFSCRATSTPSLVDTRSGSMKSAPMLDGQLVGGEGVLRPVARRAAVADEDGLDERGLGCLGRRRSGGRGERDQGGGQGGGERGGECQPEAGACPRGHASEPTGTGRRAAVDAVNAP